MNDSAEPVDPAGDAGADRSSDEGCEELDEPPDDLQEDSFPADDQWSAAFKRASKAGSSMSMQRHKDLNRQSELGMKGFIQVQLDAILRPVMERMEQLETIIVGFHTSLRETKNEVSGTYGIAKENRQTLEALHARVAASDELVVEFKAELEALSSRQRTMIPELDGVVQEVRNMRTHQAKQDTGTIPKLHNQMGDLEQRMESLVQDVRASVRQMEQEQSSAVGANRQAIQDLQSEQKSTLTEVDRLKADFLEAGARQRDIQKTAERNHALCTGLRKDFEDITSREAGLGAQINGWKDQWSKLHPAIQAVSKESAQIRKRIDHYDAALHGVQQGVAAGAASAEMIQTFCGKLRAEVQQVQGEVLEASAGLDEARKDLVRVSTSTREMHDVVEVNRQTIGRLSEGIHGMDAKFVHLTQGFADAVQKVEDIRHAEERVTSEMRNLRSEVDGAKDALHSTRNELSATSMKCETAHGELGRVKQKLTVLEYSIELCSAGFSGLQKGFSATGVTMQGRTSVALPQLSKGLGASSSGQGGLAKPEKI